MRTHLAPKAGRAIGSARLTSALWRAARDSGSVASAEMGPEQPDWCHENSPRPALPGTVCLRWLLLPARGDRPLGASVPALRAVVYRAIDQFRQVIDVFVAPRRDTAAARRFFEWAIGTTRVTPIEVTTDRAAAYPAVLDDPLPATWHRTDQYANNRVECDTGGSRRGSGRCAGASRTAVPRSCWLGMPWCRTFGVTTTSSRSRSQQAFELPPRSRSWVWRSDPSAGNGFGMPPVDQMQQSHRQRPPERGRAGVAQPLPP